MRLLNMNPFQFHVILIYLLVLQKELDVSVGKGDQICANQCHDDEQDC